LREKSVGYDRGAELSVGGKRCALGGSLTYAILTGLRNDFQETMMSQEKPSETPKTEAHASKGSGLKWLGGAALAAVLLGGGYYAWSQYGPSQSSASNEQSQPYAQNGEAPLHAGALPPQSGESVASPNESSTYSSGTQTANPTTPARRRTSSHAAATAPAEEVIGVTPASATRSASATGQDGEPIVVEAQRRPVWTRTPAAWRLAETYPTRALEQGREGEASLHCTVLNNGALDCAPVSEYPARAGFGGAALRVAHMYRHAQTRRDGKDAIGSPVNLRVVFRIDDNTRRG
jgi:TonB family protein